MGGDASRVNQRNFGFRISDFGFSSRPSAFFQHGEPGCSRLTQRIQHCRRTTISLESNNHSLPSERRGGPGPSRLSEGGGAGGGGGEKEVEGVPTHDRSPPARSRRAAVEADGTDESLLSEGASAEAAWPRSQTVDGGRPGTETGSGSGQGRVPMYPDRVTAS